MPWIVIPLPGTRVKSTHPIGYLNPEETFEVSDIKIQYGRIDGHFGQTVFVRGENTCWFNIEMISPV